MDLVNEYLRFGRGKLLNSDLIILWNSKEEYNARGRGKLTKSFFLYRKWFN